MRRYAVRFLVAVLTFGIGVALSLVFGLFRVQETNTSYILESRRSCRKELRVIGSSPLLTIDTEVGDPLRLTYLGATSDSHYPVAHREFRVENTSGNTVIGYLISGERIGQKKGVTFFDHTSNSVLLPGESQKLVIPANGDGLLLRVNQVTYQSGFSWINPRGVR